MNKNSIFASFSYFLCTVWVIVDIPSTNLVRNSTLALLNIPSFRDTMMNCKENWFKKCLYSHCNQVLDQRSSPSWGFSNALIRPNAYIRGKGPRTHKHRSVVEWQLARENKVLQGNIPHHHCVYPNWNNTHLYLKRHSTTIRYVRVVFLACNHSAGSILSTPTGRSLC